MIQPKIKMAIFEHAKEVYPHECCGIVTQKGRVQKYWRVDNVYHKPEEGFQMDALQYSTIEDNADLATIAIVHSHTGDGATTLPSAHDICICNEMEIPFVIVSLPEGDLRVVEPKAMPLTGRPWSLGSFDCWGLIMAWHKENGVTLNDFRKPNEWWKDGSGGNYYQDNYLSEGFIPIYDMNNPQYGDMVIMQLQADVWNHAGIYLGNNQLLHHMSGKLSKIDIYSGWYQDHIKMICRHKDLV